MAKATRMEGAEDEEPESPQKRKNFIRFYQCIKGDTYTTEPAGEVRRMVMKTFGQLTEQRSTK